ncbi:MFS transporter [Penicillium cf. griseofulvum]|uniref:MFS transporter n=1 Tax=Penicillium cf. griseofulvum TaxID=2972120 RepID=A0A9W9M0R5_9EURO|nr:MFS transporter [Penicillium cf. griseofulvum]KAJ5430277.1 MFS transporter [Penicillium cf. griseofulvum]KAJ5435953.1 MFS transporter [Penicillium cf. griseofulvum]
MSQATGGKSVGFYLAFLSLSLYAFTHALETTIFPISLPSIQDDFSASTVQYFWANSVFLLLTVLTQPLVTSLSNIFGRMYLLYSCLFLFAAGAAIVGAAPNIYVLIVGRLVQGIGGGGVDVLTEIIVTDITSLKERAFYVGLLNIPTALGSVLGPVVGGAFSTYVSWRWIAWIDLPLLGVGAVLSIFFLRLKPVDMPSRTKWERVDWLGMVLFVIGSTATIAPLSWGGVLYPWKSWQTYVPLTIGPLVLVVLAFHEYRTEDAMFPHRILAGKTSGFCMLGSLIHGLITAAVIYILPLYFQGVHQESPIESAISAFPLSFLAVPSGSIAAFLVTSFSQYNWIMWTGWVTISLGVGIMSLLDLQSSRSVQLGLQVPGGIGVGILYTIIAIPLQANMSVDDVGLAVGTLVFFRLTGQIIGLAISAAIFSNTYTTHASQWKNLPAIAEKFKDGSTAVYAIETLSSLDGYPSVKKMILETYAVSLHYVWIALAVIAPVGMLTSLFIECKPLNKDETGRQGFADVRLEERHI